MRLLKLKTPSLTIAKIFLFITPLHLGTFPLFPRSAIQTGKTLVLNGHNLHHFILFV